MKSTNNMSDHSVAVNGLVLFFVSPSKMTSAMKMFPWMAHIALKLVDVPASMIIIMNIIIHTIMASVVRALLL